MFGQFFGWVGDKFAQAASVVGMVVTVVSATAVTALAQGDVKTIEVETPNINWGNTAETLIGALTDVVIVGVGVALAVWALMMIVKLFKRSAA